GFFMSLVYAVLFRFLTLTENASFQVSGDLILVGGILITTGGIDSPISFLFFFVIYCIQCHATQGRGLSGGVRRYYHLWGTGRPGIFWHHYSGLFVSGIEGIF
ncbi:uncharacterized protein METZ01_LOCUS249618, partial [marine metagenome]